MYLYFFSQTQYNFRTKIIVESQFYIKINNIYTTDIFNENEHQRKEEKT